MDNIDMQPWSWTREQVWSLKSVVIVLHTGNFHNIYGIVTGLVFTMAECVLTTRAEIAFKCIQ